MRAVASHLVRLRLRAKLVLLTAAATGTVIAASAYLTNRYVAGKLLEVTEEATQQDTDEVRGVLEEQMLTGDRAALNRLVTEIGSAPGTVWVSIVDAHGTVHVSTEPGAVMKQLGRDSIEMRILLGEAPADLDHSMTIVRKGCKLVRTVSLLPNRPRCMKCHGDNHPINGMLVIDRSLAPTRRAIASSKAYLGIGGAAAILVLLASLGLGVERTVLQRLKRLGDATRQLGAGDLGARAEDESDDELGELGRDFNGMAGRLEEAVAGLAAERRQLQELVNGIADGVALLDTELRVVTTNRACSGRVPCGSRLGPGSPYRLLVRAAGLERSPGQLLPAERALESGNLEKEVVRVEGPHGERFEEIYAQPLRAPDGRVAGVIEVWRDITERKALEAGLEQSERLAALGMLASGVAHEVGNPLASIITAVDGLLVRLGEPAGASREEMREYLEIVRNQVFRCRGVTERLLGFARVPSTQVVEVDAAAAAREVLALVAPQARAQKVEVRTSLDGKVIALAADGLLEQVFLNLVVNALRAMPSGGTLSVEASSNADAVTVSFADSGPGIPDLVRRHLFEPFRSSRPQGGGTGLGLFISQTLVARCGGTIDVESPPGNGAIFRIRLPAAGAARDDHLAATISPEVRT